MMTVYSTRYATTWTLSRHGQLRAYQRGISRQAVMALVQGPVTSYPSQVAGSHVRIVVGHRGLMAVVDPVHRLIITVYRQSR